MRVNAPSVSATEGNLSDADPAGLEHNDGFLGEVLYVEARLTTTRDWTSTAPSIVSVSCLVRQALQCRTRLQVAK